MMRLRTQIPALGLSTLGRLFATARFTYTEVARKARSTNAKAKVEMRPWNPKFRRTGAVGFKLGMMTHFDQWGRKHPVTVVRIDNCQVIRSFPLGDSVIQEVGAGVKSLRQLSTTQRSLFERAGVDPKLSVQGFAVSPSALLPSGTPIYAAHFVPGQLVDTQSRSIGKGFQGAMVKWGFRGLPASHGVSLAHRHIGATGCRTDPGRVLKGKKMAGRMGSGRVTCKSLKVLKIDTVLNCLFLRGCVGGHDGTLVKIWDSKCNPIFRTTPPPYPTYIPAAERQPTEVASGASSPPSLPRFLLAPESSTDTLAIRTTGS